MQFKEKHFVGREKRGKTDSYKTLNNLIEKWKIEEKLK